MYQILWTPLAQSSYQQILNFTLEKWSITTVIELDHEVQKLLEKLENHQSLCPPIGENKDVRKCVISKQTSLLYRIQQDTQMIELITFVDNRANHQF